MAVESKLSDQEIASLMEIAHPSKGAGETIYGTTKVFPDYQAEPGETYLGMVHGIAHESSVSFVAVLLAIRALRKGFDSALYFFGIGSLNCLATRGFPTIGAELFPGMRNENSQLEKIHRRGWQGLRLPARTLTPWRARGRPHGRRHSLPSARHARRHDRVRA